MVLLYRGQQGMLSSWMRLPRIPPCLILALRCAAHLRDNVTATLLTMLKENAVFVFACHHHCLLSSQVRQRSVDWHMSAMSLADRGSRLRMLSAWMIVTCIFLCRCTMAHRAHGMTWLQAETSPAMCRHIQAPHTSLDTSIMSSSQSCCQTQHTSTGGLCSPNVHAQVHACVSPMCHQSFVTLH